ncbi:MAG: glycoside hydrolase family 127 protein [Oscillospiraceae bacterium]|nr:glycoside hydrolase family 127 protein [Oscillospiraceae bacterium]
MSKEMKMTALNTNAKLEGIIHDTAAFLEKYQLTDRSLWMRFVDQFRDGIDADNRGWRGEYWGKMMRGGALVYAYTRNPELFSVLTETVEDMLTVADSDGRVSSYSREGEFDAWDLWCRKYVLLGMEYYLDICTDEELKARILNFLCGHLDYIIQHVGEGKKRITACSRHWIGVNSSSILEPVVRLYRLTNNKAYLDFASYIVAEGGAEGVNIFELAYENKIPPYQYGVSKAYEMMSCFEGLLEYALIVGSEKHLKACINFGKAIMETDVTVIGSCGCTHELLDHSSARQTVYEPGLMQETCVTVTWMKFCSRLLKLTGERCFADAMEKSFYNAYLGALNTKHIASEYIYNRYVVTNPVEGLVNIFLPFDSYSPLRAGKRGAGVGGLQLMKDKSYYGCCTCIGAAGVGVMTENMLLRTEDGICVEFYEKGVYTAEYNGKTVHFKIDTDYPVGESVVVTIQSEEPIKIYLRIPGWCDSATADKTNKLADGYMVFEGEKEITLNLPMIVKAVMPESWTVDTIWVNRKNAPAGWSSTGPQEVFHQPEEDDFVAFTRGPLTLCADSKMGKDADSVFDPILPPVAKVLPGDEDSILRVSMQGNAGEEFTLVDYASAGKDWKTDIAAWLRTK